MSCIIRSRTQNFLVSSILLPQKPKQRYKFKTKSQTLFSNQHTAELFECCCQTQTHCSQSKPSSNSSRFRSARCNFYFDIVFVSHIVIVLVFVLIERSTIILVFVFVTKIALVPSSLFVIEIFFSLFILV